MDSFVAKKPSVTLFDLPSAVQKMSSRDMETKLVGSAFFEIPRDSLTIDSSSGWVDPFRPSQPFGSESSVVLGAYSILALRCDEYKYDKATVDILAEKYCIESGMPTAWKQMKRGQMKQDVIDHVRKVIREGTIPKTKTTYAVLDYSSSQILLMSKSSADAAAFMTLFATTFGSELIPHNFNLEFVPATSHVKILMRYLYEASSESCFRGSRLDTDIDIRNYCAVKMRGVAEDNLGTEYRVKTGDHKVDDVAAKLIHVNATDLVEIGFTITSQWGDISFFVNDEKMVPYQIDLPFIKSVDAEQAAQERINMVFWLLEAWRDVLEAAASQAPTLEQAFGGGEERAEKDDTTITLKAGDKSVTVTGEQFDKAVTKLKKATKGAK